MSYGSPTDYESQKIEKTVSSTIVAELCAFMKCFGSWQFLHELWMDISGEVVNIHSRTNAKNLVTTAKTIHLPEQKETIHMISMLRKEPCSGSIHDLAHIPTQNCLAAYFTKTSTKADNLITAVKTERWLDVDIHPNFGTRMEHKAFLSPRCRTFTHTREKDVLSSWMLWGFLSHQFHKMDHFEWCLWWLIILKNKKNKRCSIGITCRWALKGQIYLRRSVIATWIWLSIILRRRQKSLSVKVRMLRK